MSDFDAGGLLPSRPENFAVRAQGRCPLDGYQLIETDPITVQIDGEPVEVDGGWEHVIPASELPRWSEALRKIADAHAFETVAAAEKIIQAGDDEGPSPK